MIKPVRKTYDLMVGLLLWSYFFFGFLIFFLPFYLAAYPFAKDREPRYQRLHHLFFRCFFSLTHMVIPSLRVEIDEDVKRIRSALVVCNHVSYLDPLLMISQFEKQKTIAKSRFFGMPVFGWLIKQSGYISSAGKGVSAWQVLDRILHLKAYLASGGTVFVFPEGTRSRDGRIGQLSMGAFEIALRSRAPIKVLFVENSDLLYPPDRLLFNTAIDQPVRLRLIKSLDPDYDDANFSVQALKEKVQGLFEAENKRCSH